MKIERRWSFLTRMLGALVVSAVLLAGCGGSSQGAGSASDASVATVTPPASTGTDPTTGTGSTPIASTPGASTSVASTPVASTPVASDPVASTSGSSGSSSGAPSGSGSSGTTTSTTADNVTLSWSAPTENTNGSALTNLAGYIIYYGTSASAMTQTIDINTVGMLTYVVENLSAGSWYFQIVAVNSAGEQSTPSATVNASI
jgi:hypothetical protein